MNLTFGVDVLLIVAASLSGGLVSWGVLKATVNGLRTEVKELKEEARQLRNSLTTLSNSVAVLKALEERRNRD